MAEVSVNGRRYRAPERPAVVICFDGCDPAYIERGIADGILPTIAAFREERLLRHRRCRRADLHQPQQRLDRHRRAAGRARHLRQLLPRPCHRRGAHDHGRLADALRHHPGRARGRGRPDRRRHRQGQAAPDAVARARRASTSPPSTPTAPPWRRTASATSRRWWAAPSPTSTPAICRSTCSTPASRLLRAQGGDAALSVAVRFHPARACSGHARGRRLQPRRR